MEVKIIKCFVASPGDTKAERDSIDLVFQDVNRTLGDTYSFRLESIKWESNARPQFGNDGQEVLNNQILKNYDVFIGIMHARFGAETPRAGSGTEEEFDQAYAAYRNGEAIELMMYFNTEPLGVDKIDLEQVAKVRAFKIKVGEKGGLYKEYSGVDNFKEVLRDHLSAYCAQRFGMSRSNNNQQHTIPNNIDFDAIDKTLESKLEKALTSFGEEANVWLEPILSKKGDINDTSELNFENRTDIAKLIESPYSVIVQAPPQFGLTCLARYLILESWRNEKTWIYLDFRKLDINKTIKVINGKLKLLNRTKKQVDCIVLDSWRSNVPNSKKILKLLDKEYSDVSIVIMQTINDLTFREDEPDESIDREFNVLHLLALPRTQIRKVVCDYNSTRSLGDENKVLQKVLDDLDVLNIHRTAINCITLLKVTEFNIDNSPTNRTQMIEKVLFVLFDMVRVPEHETPPDVKDCEYVLGRFCEDLIRNQTFEFEKETFINDLTEFCKSRLLPLDVSSIFNILYANSIIINIKGKYQFRASFWIYYFAARRMYVDKRFKDFMLQDYNYTCYPEVIEFFTGIDRNRAEIVDKVLHDLRILRQTVHDKVGINNDFNPLNHASWNPTPEDMLKLSDEFKEDVSNSKLPDEIKDKYADFSYNQLKPYHQTVKQVFEEYSFKQLFHQIAASSKALRNSDYVDTDTKRELLVEIMMSWKLVSTVLFALAPILAEKDSVAFDGQGFKLHGDFGNDFDTKLTNIFQSNPINIVNMFKYDLYSKKIGPLLYDYFNRETDNLSRHQCASVILIERPSDWEKQVETYIVSLRKDSFYLYDLLRQLRKSYEFAFASEADLSRLRKLIKSCIAKHNFGGRKPSLKELAKISSNAIPERKVSE
jgi:hypothetical protein